MKHDDSKNCNVQPLGLQKLSFSSKPIFSSSKTLIWHVGIIRLILSQEEVGEYSSRKLFGLEQSRTKIITRSCCNYYSQSSIEISWNECCRQELMIPWPSDKSGLAFHIGIRHLPGPQGCLNIGI